MPQIKQGKFVVVAHGSAEEIQKAQHTIEATRAAETKAHRADEAAAPHS